MAVEREQVYGSLFVAYRVLHIIVCGFVQTLEHAGSRLEWNPSKKLERFD